MVRTLRFRSGAMGSIPGQGTKILHAVWCSQTKTLKNKMRKAPVQDLVSLNIKVCNFLSAILRSKKL